MRVDIATLLEMKENNELKFLWIETKHQLVGVHTKKGASKCKLMNALRHSILLLVHGCSY